MPRRTKHLRAPLPPDTEVECGWDDCGEQATQKVWTLTVAWESIPATRPRGEEWETRRLTSATCDAHALRTPTDEEVMYALFLCMTAI